MTDFRMIDLQERINKLFNNFEEESNNKENFLINLERLVIIERVLEAENFKDFKKIIGLISYTLKFELWKKPLHSRIKFLKKILESR